jgi:Ca-activated chloride channel family protein
MKTVRYTKFTGDLASELSMEDLLKALSDYLLNSGFQNPFAEFQDLDQTMEDLREALRRALEQGDAFDESLQQKIDQMAAEEKLDELIEKLIDRLERENYISTSQPQQQQGQVTQSAGQMGRATDARFEALTFWGTRRCGICWDRWGNRISDATTRATGRPAWKRVADRSRMSLATRSIWT